MENNLPITVPKCQFTPNALNINPEMKFEEWMNLGSKLKVMNEATQFWIGDWLNFGEQRYGESYSQAMDQTHFAYGTLSDYKYVSSRVKLSLRNEKLSFTHHKAVASFEPEDQKMLLDKAMEMNLSASKFRKFVYQYQLNLDLPELTQQQIKDAQTPHEDFDRVQPIIDAGTTMLEALDKVDMGNLNKNAKDYLISHLRDVVGKVGNILVKYGKE